MKLKSLFIICILCAITLLQSKPPVSKCTTCKDAERATDSTYIFSKLLFSDTHLSASGKTSCSSCHKEKFCFADSVQFNKGDDGQFLNRNTLSVLHQQSYAPRKYFWNGSSDSLNRAIETHLADSHIMGVTDSLMKDRMDKDSTFKKLMNAALSKQPATVVHLAELFEYYLKNIPQNKPTYDSRLSNMKANFSSKIYNALQLCQQCHKNTQEVSGLSNNGLDANDTMLYIIPPLNNLAFTAPYMHDGRYKTLEEVIQHYNSGIQLSPKTDSLLRDKHDKPIHLKLNTQEVKQLAALLLSIQSRNK